MDTLTVEAAGLNDSSHAMTICQPPCLITQGIILHLMHWSHGDSATIVRWHASHHFQPSTACLSVPGRRILICGSPLGFFFCPPF